MSDLPDDRSHGHFSSIPSSWAWVTLGDLHPEFQNGLASRGQPTGSPTVVLRLADISNGRISLSSARSLPLTGESKSKYAATDADVLVIRVNGSTDLVGKFISCDLPELVYCDHFIRMRFRGEVIDKPFLARIGSSRLVRKQIERLFVSTAGQKTINQGHIASIALPLPPLNEQKRIVAAIEEQFSRIDVAEAALIRARKNLTRLSAAAFTPITASVDKWRPLGEIADVVGGVTKDSNRQSDPEFLEVPYLRVANVQRGYLDLDVITTIRVSYKIASKLRLIPGDILFNEGGDRDKLGRGWVWEGKIQNCIHQNHVFRARLITDEFDPKFVSMHGNAFGRSWFEQMGKQTTNLASLSLTTLKAFPVPDIPIERQREIVREIERQLTFIDSTDSAARQSMAHSNALRSSILAAAFSGSLVPQDPADEPASVLLEQIAAQRMSNSDQHTKRGRRPRATRKRAGA
jgi:type I restriction enzyme, S subunit